MTKLFLVCLLCIISLGTKGFALGKDTLLITPIYKSEFEKKYFNEFLTNKFNFLESSLCIDPMMSETKKDQILSALNNHLLSIENKVRKEKSEENKIRLILTSTNSAFFKKYNLYASFDKLFSKGEFNCLTEALTYSYILKYFDIPFIIREEPTHVYVIAYPSTSSIIVESPNQETSYYGLTEKSKNNFIDFLIDSKVITKQELTEKGTEVWNIYYYSQKNINMQQLTALHYFYDGMLLYNSNQFDESCRQFEKSYLIDPTSKAKYMIKSCIQSTIFENVDKDNLENYIKLISISKNAMHYEGLMAEFTKANGRYLIEQNKPDEYDKVYQNIRSKISDTAFIKKISASYYYNNARALSIKGEFDKSLTFIDKAYQLNPEDLNVISTIQNLIMQKIGYPTDFEATKNQIHDYINRYPQLKGNINILRISAMCSLSLALNNFVAENKEKGSKYLTEFEKLEEQKTISVDPNLLGRTYGEYSSIYVRARDLKKAKSILEKGLTYSPNNQELMRKLKLLNDAK